MANGGYDDGYRACSCFWGRSPGSYVSELASLRSDLSGLRVLDVGCGEGKNAIFLSSRGAKVTAIDCSKLALANARRLWASSSVEWLEGDVRHTAWEREAFDVVIAYGLFHCLVNVGEIERVVHELQRATRPGGFHVICAFNRRFQDLRAHPDFSPCLLEHAHYLRLYHDWVVVKSSDADLVETHPHNGIEHTHSLTRLIVKRPE